MNINQIYRNYTKRILDLVLSILGFISLLPFFLVIFLVLLILNRGHIFFIQERVGKDEKLFKIIKFKTMVDKTDKRGLLLPDEQRITKLGFFLRKTSLDEIPQLFNVIKGDMSLIGPRPLLPLYLSVYNEFQKRRHEVKPGITGWTAVNGRNSINWDEKFLLDVFYVDNMSFSLDLIILLKTIIVVFKRKGISSSTSATMEPFKGN